MPNNKVKYDKYGGITNLEDNLAKKWETSSKKKPHKTGYNFWEKLIIKYSPRVNYLLDKDGKYKCRAQKTPKVIRIGPTNYCTARCFYCPREHIHKRASGYMDFSLYEKIISYAKTEGVDTVSFALFGEPFLHPRIMEMIDLAINNNLNVRISTNAIILKNELADKIVARNLEAIEISMDGFTREEYLKGKGVDKYKEAKANVLYLIKKAKEKKIKTIFNIHFVDIGHVSFWHKIQFIKYWRSKLHGLNINTSFYYEPHNWAGARANIRQNLSRIDRILSRIEFKKPCVYVKGLNIDWNGDVYICTNDPTRRAVIGNITKNAINEIYNGPQRMKYLREHEQGNFQDSNCAVCTVNSVLPLMFIKKRIIKTIVSLLSVF